MTLIQLLLDFLWFFFLCTTISNSIKLGNYISLLIFCLTNIFNSLLVAKIQQRPTIKILRNRWIILLEDVSD